MEPACREGVDRIGETFLALVQNARCRTERPHRDRREDDSADHISSQNNSAATVAKKNATVVASISVKAMALFHDGSAEVSYSTLMVSPGR